jgi:hypothetical protein
MAAQGWAEFLLRFRSFFCGGHWTDLLYFLLDVSVWIAKTTSGLSGRNLAVKQGEAGSI